MAKSKKKKGGKSSAGKTTANVPDAGPPATPKAALEAETLFEAGDYAGLAKLAKEAADDDSIDKKAKAEIARLEEMTRTDKVTFLVGGAATLLALIVAMITLGG
jgi:hypothetical protein